MRFPNPLTLATLKRRYKRFLADVEFDDGTHLTAHLANTGSMLGCDKPGSRVALSHHPNKGRKLEWSLELVEVNQTWVCVNTARANHIVEEGILEGRIPPLSGYPNLKQEVPYGQNSRVDILLSDDSRRCYVEVKNATLEQDGLALFPDAVTARGAKHLIELGNMVKQGHRAVAFFLVNRGDCEAFRPAEEIDPAYSRLLRDASQNGIEVMAFRSRITLEGIEIDRQLECLTD